MLFHLLTIQNSNSDDIVFQGFDYDDLRDRVARECRGDWHHGMAHAEPIPNDRDEEIEAFFHDHDRMFLIEQSFDLELPEPYAAAPQLLHSVREMLSYIETPGDINKEELNNIMEFAADLVTRLTPPDAEDEEAASDSPTEEAPLSPLEACKFALSCILDAEEMEEIAEDAFSETKKALRSAIAAAV